MAREYTALLGTIGSGIWVSADGGDAWRRPNGMWNETQVFALTPHPKDPETIFAGANDGIYRSNDRGHTFEAIDSPLSGRAIWFRRRRPWFAAAALARAPGLVRANAFVHVLVDVERRWLADPVLDNGRDEQVAHAAAAFLVEPACGGVDRY